MAGLVRTAQAERKDLTAECGVGQADREREGLRVGPSSSTAGARCLPTRDPEHCGQGLDRPRSVEIEGQFHDLVCALLERRTGCRGPRLGSDVVPGERDDGSPPGTSTRADNGA
jgi:hypothetical protein